MKEIPEPPAWLELPVERRWDGARLPGSELAARVRLAALSEGLRIEAGMSQPHPRRVPEAPPGARVDGLWRYDVVECFVASADGRYLEIELGAGGHYLALAFDAPRHRVDDFAHTALAVTWQSDARAWTSRCTVPRAWLPAAVARLNAFAIAGGEFLAHHPTGGSRPDFHRPGAFPDVRIPSWE